ncbi:hypothetical protein PGTUg99_010962 [Puccinia graminis f. sp. tritici]|uniref:Uncharacterized protein n=1 Tax=Puccinia graminis f. sp. tritici TaxID=56615 RepID=A0A5B0MT58_PUCGR|nr:hypothetical protein PGTUg99_010962 [Puccinia graminis f. sp. tritici]
MTLGAPSIGTHDWSLKLGSNEQLASFVICAKPTRFLWRDHAVAKQDEGHRNVRMLQDQLRGNLNLLPRFHKLLIRACTPMPSLDNGS